MFKPKGPQGVVADKGGSGKAEIPLAERKLPKKKTKKKAKKHKAHDAGKNKGKIAAMLKGKFAAKDTKFTGGNGAKANQIASGNTGGASQFVPIAPQSLKF